jgi:hypothetical protein
MAKPDHPTLGKICYIEIPTLDIQRSSSIYQREAARWTPRLRRRRWSGERHVIETVVGNIFGLYQEPKKSGPQGNKPLKFFAS